MKWFCVCGKKKSFTVTDKHARLKTLDRNQNIISVKVKQRDGQSNKTLNDNANKPEDDDFLPKDASFDNHLFSNTQLEKKKTKTKASPLTRYFLCLFGKKRLTEAHWPKQSSNEISLVVDQNKQLNTNGFSHRLINDVKEEQSEEVLLPLERPEFETVSSEAITDECTFSQQHNGFNVQQMRVFANNIKDSIDQYLNPKGARQLDNYKLTKQVSQGSYGTVYSAIEKFSDQLVAVKKMSLAFLPTDVNVISEVRILRDNEMRHNNLVRGLDCFIDHNFCFWIVMELMNGGTLTDLLCTDLTETQMGVVMREILNGLTFLHSNGWVHRDLQSNHVLLKLNGAIKLTGFGLAKKLAPYEVFPKEEHPIGTLCWMAPEVINGEECINQKSDVWSAGIVLVEMVVGKPPNYQLMYKNNTTINHVFDALNSHCSPEGLCINAKKHSHDLQDFLYQRCLKIDPLSRCSAQDLLAHRFVDKVAQIPVSTLMPNIEKATINTHTRQEQ